MSESPSSSPAPEAVPRPRRWRRALPWIALVALLLVVQSLLVWLTLSYESNRAQERVDTAAVEAAGEIHQALGRDLQSLQALLWNEPSPTHWRADAGQLLRSRRQLLRVEMRAPDLAVTHAIDSPFQAPIFTRISRDDLDLDTELACAVAQRRASPAYSRSYFVPLPEGLGVEVMDLCLPVLVEGRPAGFMVATISLMRLLEEVVPAEIARTHELSFIKGDGTRLARAGVPRGAGVFRASRVLDLPGLALQLRLDSSGGRPQLIPNLATALVLGLSLALGAVVMLLARDVRKRANAESALAEALAFRKAMENSLVTGLRARDRQGRITYVNPAFCQMVGFDASELIGRMPPPYWPPELAPEYTRRQQARLLGSTPSREGFETIFMRRSGERFPVMIFEAPLVDGSGRQTGWMSAALDVSAQRRMEETARQQQERLQAAARLATVGEMASMLSHELNQPLAAIASYATGSLNLMNEPDTAMPPDETRMLLRQAAQRIAEQAERAGRVIKSVHDFVRRRHQSREGTRTDLLIEAVLPLVRLQGRKTGVRIELDLPDPVPRVVCDRTMLEQVLLNLTRNGIQAMESHTSESERVLVIRVRQSDARWVTFSVIDHGPGVPAEVAQRLFTPFFTTRSEGMGLGLSLCRTVIEQHGGTLDFENLAAGAAFHFTLPAETQSNPRTSSKVEVVETAGRS